MSVDVERPRAVCADPKYLPIVDAAFQRPGSQAQREIEKLCKTCPLAADCLGQALERNEHGPWGGTNERARHKVRRGTYVENLYGIHYTPPKEPR